MKQFNATRKPSEQKSDEGGMKKVPKKKDYKGPKRIRGSFRILQDDDDFDEEGGFSEHTELSNELEEEAAS
jgi:hypothetical protein